MSSSSLYQELVSQIKQLNQYLTNDQQAFVDGNQAQLDESNNQKIALRNTIESLTDMLQDPVNTSTDPVIKLALNEALTELAANLHINNSVIKANQSHYLNLFRALMNATSKEEVLAYEQHAE